MRKNIWSSMCHLLVFYWIADRTMGLGQEAGIPLCSTSQCIFMPPMTPPQPVNISIEMETMNATIIRLGKITKVGVARITREKSFCYVTPLMIDKGEECEMRKPYVSLTKQEVERMFKEGNCMVGEDCRRPDERDTCRQLSFYGGPCRDSERHNFKLPTKPGKCEKSMTPFLHVCTQCWGCEIIKYEIEPQVKIVEGGIMMEVSVPGHNSVLLPRHEFSGVRELDNCWYLHTSDIEASEAKVSVGCLDEKGKSLCITKEEVLELQAGNVFEVGIGGIGSVRNFFLRVNGSGAKTLDTHFGSSAKSVTQEGLMQEIQDLQFENKQSRYNSMQLAKSLTETQGMINNIGNSLSKTNNRLIGDLIGRGMITHWESEEIIKACSCVSPSTGNGAGQCSSRFSFDSGQWMLRSESRECLSRKRNLTAPINIFSGIKIETDQIGYPSLQEVVDEIKEVMDSKGSDIKMDDNHSVSPSSFPMYLSLVINWIDSKICLIAPYASLFSAGLWVKVIYARANRAL